MSWSIFSVVTGAFVLRGLFLGFVGVISKVVGIILAYYITFNFRTPVAEFIATQTTLTIPITVLPIISSILLFFGTLIITGFAINLMCKLLATLAPPLKPLFSNGSITAKLFGAITNGAIGALLVLLGIWGYDKATEADPNRDTLHKLAHTVGTTVFTFATEGNNVNITSAFTKKNNDTQNNTHAVTTRTIKGTAHIVSEEDPTKTVSIETMTQMLSEIAEKQNLNVDDNVLFETGKIQALIKHSAIKDMALEHMKNNPEAMLKLMQNPDIKPILESIEKQQTQ